MNIKYNDFNITAHELDNKLSVLVESKKYKVEHIESNEEGKSFPSGQTFKIVDGEAISKPKRLKKIIIGDYKIIVGINFDGELVIYHKPTLFVSHKKINGKPSFTLAFTKDIDSSVTK